MDFFAFNESSIAEFGGINSPRPSIVKLNNVCVSLREIPTEIPNLLTGSKVLVLKKKLNLHVSKSASLKLRNALESSAPLDYDTIKYDMSMINKMERALWIPGITFHLVIKTNFAHFFLSSFWRFFVFLSYLPYYGLKHLDNLFLSPIFDVAPHDLQRHNVKDLNVDRELFDTVHGVKHFSFAVIRVALSMHKKLFRTSPHTIIQAYEKDAAGRSFMYCFEELWSVSPGRGEDTRDRYYNGVLKQSPLILFDPINGKVGLKNLFTKFREEISFVFEIGLPPKPITCIKKILIYTREDAGQRVIPTENLYQIQDMITSMFPMSEITVIKSLKRLLFREQVELFSRHDLLINPHGSNSLNQIFMPIGAIVFESMPSCIEISATHRTGISEALSHHFRYIPSLECYNRSLDKVCQYTRHNKMPKIPGKGWSSFSASKGHQRCPTVSFNIERLKYELGQRYLQSCAH